jgi:type II secretory pathway predicted ATPase ExeA
MILNYNEFWKVKEKPFEESHSPRFFFESSEHTEALNRLRYVISDGNMLFGMLTGEIGSGKTITRRVLENYFSRREVEIVSLENSSFSFNDLIFEIIVNIQFMQIDFEIDSAELFKNRGDLYYTLTVSLIRLRISRISALRSRTFLQYCL